MAEPSTHPAALSPPQPAFTLPGGISGPQVPVSMLPADDPAEGPEDGSGAIPVKTPVTTAPASQRPRPPAAASSTTPRTTAPPPAVTGRFQVIDSYGDSFAGEVLLTNTATDARSWKVSLAFPSNVGGLRVSCLEGQPQPTLARRGRTYTWTATVMLSAGSTAQLRFHFDRSGSGQTPSSCTVNGSRCVL